MVECPHCRGVSLVRLSVRDEALWRCPCCYCVVTEEKQVRAKGMGCQQ